MFFIDFSFQLLLLLSFSACVQPVLTFTSQFLFSFSHVFFSFAFICTHHRKKNTDNKRRPKLFTAAEGPAVM